MSVLQLRGVSKTYGHEPAVVHALGGVDLSVRAGETVAVMGPAGRASPSLDCDFHCCRVPRNSAGSPSRRVSTGANSGRQLQPSTIRPVS